VHLTDCFSIGIMSDIAECGSGVLKFIEFRKYFGIFVLAVLIIAVYKTFDNIGVIVSAVAELVSVLSPIFIAFVLAFLMYPLCQKTEVFIADHFPAFICRRSRTVSVVAVYVMMIAVTVGVLYVLLPTVAMSFVEFVRMLPHFAQTVVNMLNELPYVNIKLSEIDRYIDFQEFLHESGWLRVDAYTSGLMDISTWIVNVFLTVIMSVYILIDRKSLAAIGVRISTLLMGKSRHSIVMMYVRRGVEFSYKYLFCVIADAIIVFIISFAIMSVMRVKYAPVLALMTGILNVVPYFGSIAAGLVSVLITLITGGFSKGIILAVLLVLLQQIDANVIQPHLINESLNVRPFWVLVGIIVGGYFFGMWGILVAVPVLALVRTIVFDYFAGKS